MGSRRADAVLEVYMAKVDVRGVEEPKFGG